MSSRPDGRQAVFDPAGTGYHTFRIPALLAIPDSELADSGAGAGDPVLLAFCEGRVESASDSGLIELVLRRSLDGGRSWEPLQVVCAAEEKTCGNPAPVLDPATGDVVLLSVQNGARVDEHAHLTTGTAPPEDVRRVFVQRSSDQGRSWSPPLEITADVKRPNWGWYATGPGHGIAVRHGDHRGRLIVPANHSRIPDGDWQPNQLPPLSGGHAIISDDGGRTWRIGFVDDNDGDLINANETAVAELADGRLIFNARNHRPSSGPSRVQAVSVDGGESLITEYAPVAEIVAPQIQAGMISPDGSTLLLTAPGVADRRADLTVRIGGAAGRWRTGPVINNGPSGYSDLATLPGDRIGLLYEAGSESSYEKIWFETRPLSELLDPNIDSHQPIAQEGATS